MGRLFACDSPLPLPPPASPSKWGRIRGRKLLLPSRRGRGKFTFYEVVTPLCPDAGDGFPAVPALSVIQMHFPDHISCPPDNLLCAVGAKSVFALVAGDVPDVNILQAAPPGDRAGPLERCNRRRGEALG